MIRRRLVGWATAVTPAAFVPMGAARLATARALATVARLDGTGPRDPAAARGALAHAREVVAVSARGEHTTAHARDLSALLADADLAVERWLVDGDTDRLHQVAAHERELRKVKRRITIPSRDDAPELPPVGGFLADGARRLRTREFLANGARIAAASALAGWVAAAAGLGNPLWASLGAIAAMQGLTFTHTAQRAIARLLGNIGGAAIAAVLIAASLNYWQVAAVIVVLQVVAEQLLVVKNYALTSLVVTPMALLMVGLGTPISPGILQCRGCWTPWSARWSGWSSPRSRCAGPSMHRPWRDRPAGSRLPTGSDASTAREPPAQDLLSRGTESCRCLPGLVRIPRRRTRRAQVERFAAADPDKHIENAASAGGTRKVAGGTVEVE